MSNPRIPRKPGQPANSKKHSDLYTDENPKGTIHGLGFKDVATAKASVSKIRNSSRSHAHKIQAAVAMEQRAREMGKSSEAAVYRKFINSMKKKTKEMNEEKKNGRCPAGQYYCYDEKKCKKIPMGYRVGSGGMLEPDEDKNGKKNGKNGGKNGTVSNGNGNGNGGNGNGSGNGGSSAGMSEGAAWTKKSGKNQSGGLNEKGRKSYERENPGSDLKAPSKKVGNPRRKSFCARMKGMKKKLTSSKTANDPNSRINKSLRAWNC